MEVPFSPLSRKNGLRWCVALLTGWSSSLANAQRLEFDILKADAIIGRIIALRDPGPRSTQYLMTSYSEFDVVLKQTVKTSMSAEYRDGTLIGCHSLVRVNGNLRDSSHMVVRNGQSHRYVHPKPFVRPVEQVEWTTARMYYEEPTGQHTIFVESVLDHCPLVRTAPGRYTLRMPNGNENRYMYRDGILIEVVVDRALVDLIFRRADL